MKRRLLPWLIAVGLLAALPQQAWANAGTPLMWAGMLHLVFGNTLIGLLEGFLLGCMFRVPRGKAIVAMIAANYTSAWLGGLLIRGAIVKALHMDLTNAWMWFWIMVAVTYCLTLLLEWPFVAWGFRGTQGWLKRSVRGSLVVQSVSYILLFGWYWMASGTSLYTETRIVAPGDLSLPESVMVYFIAPSDGNVYQRRLTGAAEQKVWELRSTNGKDRLFVRPSTLDPNRWDLMARLKTGDGNPKLVTILTNLLVETAPDWRSTHYEGMPPNFGKVQRLGSAANSEWKFWAGFWPVEGLQASREGTGEQLRLSYETPFGAWTVRNAVHLPTDKVLFQLGGDQICGFDPERRRVALLWRGRGPVAVIDRGSPR